MKGAGATCLEWAGQLTLHDKRIAVLHGDRYRDYQRLLAQAPDYLFFGHTHVPQDERERGTRLINPGALHRAAEYTVALLDLATDELRFLEVA
jgi:predicted phosphodiesterase